MRSWNVGLVIGTRPEAIKLAPVAHALAQRGIEPLLVLTGQHVNLDPAYFGLDGYPEVRLSCPGEADPHAHVDRVRDALRPLLNEARDLVIVQGDTSSAFGSALAAFATGVPVAHVEAGLRTYDPLLPWPEEEYRVAIDAGADLLFAPTPLSAANLRSEKIRGEIHVTGNTGIDSLLAVAASLPEAAPAEPQRPRILVTCHRRESWGDGLKSIAAALIELAQSTAARIEMVLHPNPHVATRIRELLHRNENIILTAACTHRELVQRVRDADLVLSDSGGIQEEAPVLGTPVLVLRDKTERPEAIASGNSRLVGTSTERIVTEVRSLLENPAERANMGRRTYPFGDGRAAPRIAAIVEDWLERRLSDAAKPFNALRSW